MDIQITENGKIRKRKQAYKRIKLVVGFVADVTAVIATKSVEYTVEKLDEVTKPVRLELIDYKYGTSLRAQYFAGLRTQRILRAKRQFNIG